MSMNVIPIAELELNDPRRWSKPTWKGCFASLHEELWDDGFIIADGKVDDTALFLNHDFAPKRRSLPCVVDDSALFLNHDFAPKRRSMPCVVDDSAIFLNHDFVPKRRSMPCVASALSAPSSPLGCSGCGITHWKRLCPNPVQRSVHCCTDNSSFQT